MYTSKDTTKVESVSNRRARREEIKRTIAILVERFPSFVEEKSKLHRPLKVGIHADLLAVGLTPGAVKNALVSYTGRLEYQRALASGGPR